jgi:hypothetical protein
MNGCKQAWCPSGGDTPLSVSLVLKVNFFWNENNFVRCNKLLSSFKF